MKMDTLVLMAYVDGELAPDDAREVEAQIAQCPEVAACVENLAASRLSHQAAFARQKLPPVPPMLRAEIDRMARAHATWAQPAAANDSPVPPGAPRAAAVRSPSRTGPGWLLAAFAAGVVACATGLSLVRYHNGAAAPSAAGDEGGPGWVQAAAGYQQLYTRETIDTLTPDPTASAATLDAIRQDDGMAIAVPDLGPGRLQLKRIQRLRFHGKPLEQIVYLPEHGAPVALCVMRDDGKPDTGIAVRQIAGMRVVLWRSKSLAYALIANGDGAALSALGRKIAAGEFAKLFAGG